jgi:DNA-binding beta-propeller fold protein YncE
MSFRRVGGLAATFVATLLWMSCGEVYRPVVIPISNNPPNPANFHAVFGISANVAPNLGTALQIDVSGDSNIGVANMGINPTHAAILPTNSRIFVANAGSVVNGDPDVITAFTPASSSSIGTGLGNPFTYTLPNVGPNQSSSITAITESGNLVTVTLAAPIGKATVGGPIVIFGVNPAGYDGNFTISSVSGTTIQYVDPVTGLANASAGTATVPLPTFCSYQPDFVTTTQTSAVYVANYGQENGANCSLASTDSIAALNTASNNVASIAYLPAGSHPVLLAETPNALNLYVVNQGDGKSAATVINLSTVDLSTTATIPIGVNPSWITTRPDGQRAYVVTAGDGQVFTIRVDNTVASAQPVGVGANYALYDNRLNRLYVTSPAATNTANGLVYVFSATSDSPTPLVTPSGNPPGALIIPPVPPCVAAPATCGPVIPVSVAALPDGSRFYVASYQRQSPCSDTNAGTGACIIPMVTVFEAGSLTIKAASSSMFGAELSLLSSPPFAIGQYAVPEVASCVPAAIYSPSSTRFRMYATAAVDSSHVYVSICDAGGIADISTTTNTISQGTNADDRLVIDLLAPFSAAAPGPNNQPAPQNPVFLLTGQ